MAKPNLPPRPFKPTKADLLAAHNKTVPDVIAPNLKVLFVGINPGLYTAAIGHHFGRPGNRFWPALYAGGFTRRLLSPFEEHELLEDGYGVTNMVERATNLAQELNADELRAGGKRLLAKIRKYRPRWVAILGITSFRIAFDKKTAILGRQPEDLCGAHAWLLPNPSGLNAHATPKRLAKMFQDLHDAVISCYAE